MIIENHDTIRKELFTESQWITAYSRRKQCELDDRPDGRWTAGFRTGRAEVSPSDFSKILALPVRPVRIIISFRANRTTSKFPQRNCNLFLQLFFFSWLLLVFIFTTSVLANNIKFNLYSRFECRRFQLLQGHHFFGLDLWLRWLLLCRQFLPRSYPSFSLSLYPQIPLILHIRGINLLSTSLKYAALGEA